MGRLKEKEPSVIARRLATKQNSGLTNKDTARGLLRKERRSSQRQIKKQEKEEAISR